MAITLRTARDLLLDLLFPPRCGICGALGAFLCSACRLSLHEASPPRCPRCWRSGGKILCPDCRQSPSPLEGIRSVYCFEGGAQTLVYQLKYQRLHALAQPMGELLAVWLAGQPLPVDLLVPVPLHRRRQRMRGFNQSERLGRVIAERSGIELDSRTLRRRRNTPQQTRLADKLQREINVRGAFACQRRLEGRRVLLVDDVCTTGATLRECATSLHEAGALSVWALTFARAD
ncbi:MAG: ComF family protein [Dehalococcoidia bacterium]